MHEDEPTDLIASRLTLIGANGNRAELTPDGFTLEGPERGKLVASFDGDGEPTLALYAKDGRSWIGVMASADGTGLTITTPATDVALVAAGLSLTGTETTLNVSAESVTLKARDGETFFSIPLLPSVARFVAGLIAKAQRFLTVA